MRARTAGPGAPAAAAALLAAGLALLPALAPKALAQALEGRVTRVTLDNGMRFLIVRRGTAPVFSAILRFKVGSVDDPGGASGLAHLFEHLAFKGTTIIGTRDARAEAEALDALDRAAIDLEREIDRGREADPKRLETLRAGLKALQEQAEAFVVKTMWEPSSLAAAANASELVEAS